ncbi:MAG: hypothetical protein PF489_15815 [Salinivirgaceae bacterium]|jgi:exo-poly-alpha-galacturonosidase|nr:hypothetical protein [Salinivirgaceae bacterium]
MKNNNKKIAGLLLSMIIFLSLKSQKYRIVDFGEIGDRKTLKTRFVQNAIDQCILNVRGAVSVAIVVFYIRAIFLKSNIILHLIPSFILQDSYDTSDYPAYDILSDKKFSTIMSNG